MVPFRRRWTRPSDYGAAARPWWRRFGTGVAVLSTATFAAVLLWPATAPAEPETGSGAALAGAGEAELRARRWPTSAEALDAAQPAMAGRAVRGEIARARFARCGSGPRVDCVVDGDTFWFRGEKIRVADINTPEVSEPQCAREAALGAAATGRLLALLNQGPFTLEPVDRDRYGRLLRTVTRDGESLGLVLVREGLAEEWRGRRGSWC